MTIVGDSSFLNKEVSEIEDLQKYLSELKTEYSIQVIGALLEGIQESLKTPHNIDRELLSTSLEKLDTFNKSVNIELQPLMDLIKSISQQNIDLTNSIKQLISSNKEDDKYSLLVEMAFSTISKTNEFLESNISSSLTSSYKEQLIEINKTLQKNKPTEWVFEISRDRNLNIETVIAKPKTGTIK